MHVCLMLDFVFFSFSFLLIGILLTVRLLFRELLLYTLAYNVIDL